jgi:DNA-binding Lrp family transcriptional regulator
MVNKPNNHEKQRILDDSERKIVRELIKNPRASDNHIAKKTGIPTMTVNRKRKKLEREKFLRYYVSLDKGEFGLHIFGAKRLFIIKFKIGITRKKYLEVMESDARWRDFNSRFISFAYLGEKDGRLALILALDAKDEDHLVEEFNGKIVPFIQNKFGEGSMTEISTVNLGKLIRVHHNYMPYINLEDGKIKDNWPDEMIFVDNIQNGDSKEN